ncbi:hypothetical protein [Amycolatopsis sp. NPDC051372]|uniref:hypothetical protein n=1 Tax=Amycolatopsis sp. NPDC051372 TaxID=3155669 RepID=UPI003429755A
MVDYNLWFQYNHARDDATRTAEFRADTVATYRGAYQAAFTRNRAPLVVANHFNDRACGAFAEATRLHGRGLHEAGNGLRPLQRSDPVAGTAGPGRARAVAESPAHATLRVPTSGCGSSVAGVATVEP